MHHQLGRNLAQSHNKVTGVTKVCTIREVILFKVSEAAPKTHLFIAEKGLK